MENQETQNSHGLPKAPKAEEHKKILKVIGLLVVILLSYIVGYKAGIKGYVFIPSQFKILNKANVPQTVDYQLLWDAIAAVKDKYIEAAPTPLDFLYGAVKGAVAAAGDPYTTYFTPQELTNFSTQLQGNFEGIGAEIGQKDGNIVIVAPLEDSPAKKAGLMPQDIIVKVDGQSTSGWTIEQAVSKIRGPKGTTVTLNIFRQGKSAPFDVKIVRDNIIIKSVKWEYKEVDKNGRKEKIAVITISQFGNDTKPLFEQAVSEILKNAVAGIIVDLRNDPGGYLQTAVDLSSYWVQPGQVVVSEVRNACSSGALVGADCGTQKYLAEGNNELKNIKTVVLINGGSASAAEIFSGALHDYKMAELIGEKSFGKGSVQELVELKEGGAVKVTVAKWVTPSGQNLNKEGLNPDVAVKLTDLDVSAGKDPQMDKALQEVVK